MQRQRLFPIVLVALLVTAACAQRRPGQPLRPGFNMFSVEQDIQLGQEAAQQARQQLDVVKDQNLQNYLARVGNRLASTPRAKESGFPFSFTLINDPSVNAFALPGGPMFVNSGLLRAAANEAQLAGVMAHEMSHVILRHGTNQVSRANLLQLPAMLASGAVGSGSLFGQLAQLGIGLGFNSVLLNYSRSAENEADALGAHIMAAAGYNPIESARFFETLAAEGGSRGPEFLSSHPDPGNRVASVQAEIRTLPQSSYGYETGEFRRAQQLVAALPPPRKTRTAQANAAPPSRTPQGTAQPPSGIPAGGWQELRGRSFSISYPGNWEAFGGQQSNSVTIAPRQGIVQAANGGVSVGYGTVLSYYVPDGVRTVDLRRETGDLVNQLRAQNPGTRVASSGSRRVRVGGADGLITMLEGQSPYGGQETNALLTVARPEGLFYMVFVAPQRDFNQLESTFSQMIQSIRFAR
ncbi:MAG TPA: M48 family metallopeptidase [Bryobacteraceae bacterium]|nr:M48 family metallopeptidase [Bryobacteraceae bacterium]